MKRTLSNREMDCLILYGQGRKATEIAADMKLSVKTISTYLSRAQDKLRVVSRSDLRTLAAKFTEAMPHDRHTNNTT
jgi:DNA-binding CsgD family transcriptional regulator